MKKRLIFLLALSFCDVLFTNASDYLNSLFSRQHTNRASFSAPAMLKIALNRHNFSYHDPAPSHDLFQVRIGYKNIKFSFNEVPPQGPRSPRNVNTEIIRYAEPIKKLCSN